jgi:cytochrome c
MVARKNSDARRGFPAEECAKNRRTPGFYRLTHFDSMRYPVILSVAATMMGHFAPAAEPPQDFRFKVEQLFSNIPQPMELEIAPDGRIFFNEYRGKLKVWHPETKQIVEAGKLEVFAEQENGFLGFALDPKFAENGWIYCLYSPQGYAGQSLSRFTMKGDVLDVASEKVLLKYEEQRKECCHHAGSVEFGPDGLLYWSTGDNTHPHGDSQGYAPIDERPGKEPWDAQKSAANTMSLAGKICRIRPLADGTYEIPPGNLFAPGTPKTRPEIYAMGCRNPWRMTVDQRTGFVYWGEVGPDAGDDGKRGPRGYDEINQAKKAGNFGWPYFIGDNFAYYDYDYTTKQVGALFDPAKPINEGPNNTGLRELPPAVPAFLYWPYRQPRKWPEFGEGGRTACAGPVFHWQPEFEKTGGFPQYFDRCLLFWDWERPFIKWARLDAESNLAGLEPFTAVVTANKSEQIAKLKPRIDDGATLMKRPVDAVFGKDGCLYFMDYGETWGANADSRLLKISYQRGNLAPVAKATVKNGAGREPLTVELSAEGSRDLDGDALSYAWTLQPGGKVLGSTASLRTTIAEPGNYVAELRVSDGKGGVGTASVPLLVGNTAPVVKFEEPQDGDFFAAERKLAYRVSITDAEDGASSAKPDEFGARTLVSSAFRRADGRDEAGDPGLSLMKQSDCFNCHTMETPLIGPSLVDIATKYRSQAGAAELLNKKVREGGNGVWGQIPMLPHPQHTTDEVAIMLRWMLALEKGKGGPVLIRGLTGEITAPKGDKPGEFILEATYTDTGRAPAGTLSGKARVTLRNRRVEAESGEIQGPKTLGFGSAGGGKGIGAIDHGHWVKFSALNLSGTSSITARAASGGQGGSIEFHIDSPTGPILGAVEVPPTGGWEKWKEATVPLQPPPGRADVYAVFVNPGKGGLMNLDWVQFNP